MKGRRTAQQTASNVSLAGQIPCREVLYNVKGEGSDAGYFVGVICRHGDGLWRWAVTQPTAQHW